MKHLRKKAAVSILLLLVLCGSLAFVLFHTYQALNDPGVSDERTAGVEILKTNAEKALSLYRRVYDSVDSSYQAKAELTAVSLRNLSDVTSYEKPQFLHTGAVIRVEDGTVTVPEAFPEDVLLDADMFTGSSGIATSQPCESVPEDDPESAPVQKTAIVYYSRIRGPYYYIEWEDAEANENRKLSRFDVFSSLSGTKKIFDSYVMVFDTNYYASDTATCMFVSDGLERWLPALEDEVRAALPAGSAVIEAGSPSVQEIGQTSLDLYIRKDDSLHVAIAYLVPHRRSSSVVLEQTGILTTIFLIVCIIFLTWGLSVLELVRNHTLCESQKKEFSLRRVRRVSAAFLAIGCLAVFASSILFQCLFRLYNKYHLVGNTIEVLQEKIEEYDIRKAAAEDTSRSTYEKCAESVAALLSEYPELKTREQFQSYCDILGTDYLMLYDKNGKEILTNSPYKGLFLSMDPADPSCDFRRLLSGVSVISHELETDALTGAVCMKIGACVAPKEDDGAYQALLMAVPESQITESDPQTTGDIMAEYVTGSTLAFSVDPDSLLIVASNRDNLVGENVIHEGVPESFLHDDLMDFFIVNGEQYYGEAQMADDGLLYFCAAEKGNMYSNVITYALICAGFTLLFMAVLILYVLHGYGKDFGLYASQGGRLRQVSNEIVLAGGRIKWSVDPSKRWRSAFRDQGDRKPIHNAMIALQILLAFCAVLTAFQLINVDVDNRIPLFTYIFMGQWARGFNLFAITSVLILLLEVVAVLILLKLIIRIISTLSGTRGETVCRLLLNLLDYIAVVVFLFLALQYLGFDVTTLLASLGLLTFAISLGAKDLLTDVLAGISIIFEGSFQVGDIIEINGYWGRVLEIGVRTTKLEGLGGNIKIIGNRDINNVINKTRKNSWYAAEFGIPTEQIKEVEQLFLEELPGIGSRIPEIISGPYYKGIESFAFSFGHSVARILIIAECKEKDYRYVRHELNHEIADLFDEHHIQIM